VNAQEIEEVVLLAVSCVVSRALDIVEYHGIPIPCDPAWTRAVRTALEAGTLRETYVLGFIERELREQGRLLYENCVATGAPPEMRHPYEALAYACYAGEVSAAESFLLLFPPPLTLKKFIECHNPRDLPRRVLMAIYEEHAPAKPEA